MFLEIEPFFYCQAQVQVPGPRSGPGPVPVQVQKVQGPRSKDLDLGYDIEDMGFQGGI